MFKRLWEEVLQMIIPKISIYLKTNFLEEPRLASIALLGKDYNMFGFKLIHNLHLSTSLQLKECSFKLLGSDRVMINLNGVVEQSQPLSHMMVSILYSLNSFLAANDLKAGVLELHVNFSSKNSSVQLNCLFLNINVSRMLEGKDYRAKTIVFSIIETYTDRATDIRNGKSTTFSIACIPISCIMYCYKATAEGGLS